MGGQSCSHEGQIRLSYKHKSGAPEMSDCIKEPSTLRNDVPKKRENDVEKRRTLITNFE